MSDSPSSTDLHTIFGIEQGTVSEHEPAVEVEPAVDVEPAGPSEGEEHPAEHAGVPPLEASEADREGAAAASEGQWSGITRATRRGSSARFLTDVIVDLGFASAQQVKDAVDASRNAGTTPERILVESGALTNDHLARALAERYGLDHLDLSVFSVDMGAANLITGAAAKRYQAVPVAFVDKRTLLVAMADPSNVLAVDDIAIMTGHEVRVAVAAPEDVAALITRLNRLEDAVSDPDALTEADAQGQEVVDLHESAEDAPTVKLVNQIIAQAVERGASDVHLSPHERELQVRFRIDGVLQDVTTVPGRSAPGVVSRVKIMAELTLPRNACHRTAASA